VEQLIPYAATRHERWQPRKPSTAILVLRHPSLCDTDLGKVQQIYSSKVRVGGSVAVVQDPEGVFARTRLLGQSQGGADGFLNVASWQHSAENARSAFVHSPVQAVAAAHIFGGWPALSLVLSHPMRRIASEVEFMWPTSVSSVVVKQRGCALDPDTGLGSLLRNPTDLSISIDGVDYPLEHDAGASEASTHARKQHDRKVLMKVIWSQAGGCVLLLLVWLLLEWRMAKTQSSEPGPTCEVEEVIARQKRRLEMKKQQLRQSRLNVTSTQITEASEVSEVSWSQVSIGWDLQHAGSALEDAWRVSALSSEQEHSLV